MTARTLFSLLQRLVLALVLAASGGYLLVYLYRWEWNRALISGLVFVAAEIALVAIVVLRRMASNPAPSPEFDLALRRLREAGVERRHPFRWLERPDRLGVFIPVLLGAGVVLSALAYVVERLAEVTARATVDRHLARRLAVLAPSRRPGYPASVLRWERSALRPGPVVGLVAVLVVIGLLVQVLAEATQSRPDGSPRPATTTIAVAISQRDAEPLLDTAAALWTACRPVLPAEGRPHATFEVRDGTVVLHLAPGIRRLATRRLTGCLGDATLSSVRAVVRDVEHVRDPVR